jgi:hypothetical protein
LLPLIVCVELAYHYVITVISYPKPSAKVSAMSCYKKHKNAMKPYQRKMCANMENNLMAVTLPLTIEKLRPGSWYVKLPSPAPNAGNWFLLCCYSPLQRRAGPM